MNSCLYECSVMHHRLTPKAHHFKHDLFMFYLDLDELDSVTEKILLFSHNRNNVYSFWDTDHEPAGPQTLKERIVNYLRQKGVEAGPKTSVRLLTLPRVAGYIFNPISVYYCFDSASRPLAIVIEVGNTFREMKLYLLPRACGNEAGLFHQVIPKHFYVSPFSRLDLNFDFQLRVPDETLEIRIDDRDGIDRVLLTTLTGCRTELTNRNLTWLTLLFPLVTLKVIVLIHWHALRLWLKRVPFYRKAAAPEQQRDVLRPHATLAAKSE